MDLGNGMWIHFGNRETVHDVDTSSDTNDVETSNRMDTEADSSCKRMNKRYGFIW